MSTQRPMKTRSQSLFLVVFAACGLIAFAQSRGGNWPTYGGDAQRSGWEGADAAISKDTVKNFRLLWKTKLETALRGMRPVLPPVIQGRLISYRGFKELAFVATNADIVYAIDADVGTLFWQKHLEYSVREPQVTTSSWRCPGGLTAMPTMPVPGRGAAAGRGGPAPAPGQRGSAFVGGSPSVYAISSDGRLHRLNTSTGDDMTQPVSVLPANARASSLTMVDNTIYTVTTHECNDAPNAVWSIDLAVDPPKVRSFALGSGVGSDSGWHFGAPTLGSDNTVYVQTSAASVLTLSPRDLQRKQVFPSGEGGGFVAVIEALKFPSPVVFTHNNRELVAASCWERSLCLFDMNLTQLAKTPEIVQPTRNASSSWERGMWGNLTSWQDSDGTRWIVVPTLGPLHPELKPTISNGSAPNGSLVAFKVEEKNGAFELTPAWISRDMPTPLPAVVANGVVFVLSAGEFTRQLKNAEDINSMEERPKGSTHATLYALDARTGKELYSSGNQIPVPASLTGMTVSNGRVYFGGIDGTLYAFGIPMER